MIDALARSVEAARAGRRTLNKQGEMTMRKHRLVRTEQGHYDVYDSDDEHVGSVVRDPLGDRWNPISPDGCTAAGWQPSKKAAAKILVS